MATILLVDDDHAILELLRLIVEDCGHQALTAHDGAVGLALAQQHVPNMVLTDLMMPFMDGFELVAALQADPALRAIPIVILTAGIVSAERHSMFGFVQDMIAKPFGVAQVEALFDGLGETN
jgi:CheY-like chemotaxis protein